MSFGLYLFCWTGCYLLELILNVVGIFFLLFINDIFDLIDSLIIYGNDASAVLCNSQSTQEKP